MNRFDFHQTGSIKLSRLRQVGFAASSLVPSGGQFRTGEPGYGLVCQRRATRNLPASPTARGQEAAPRPRHLQTTTYAEECLSLRFFEPTNGRGQILMCRLTGHLPQVKSGSRRNTAKSYRRIASRVLPGVSVQKKAAASVFLIAALSSTAKTVLPMPGFWRLAFHQTPFPGVKSSAL
jgi:hypothetical protein